MKLYYCIIVGGGGVVGDAAAGVSEHRNSVRRHRNVAVVRVSEQFSGGDKARRRRFGGSLVDLLYSHLHSSA